MKDGKKNDQKLAKEEKVQKEQKDENVYEPPSFEHNAPLDHVSAYSYTYYYYYYYYY